jgi:tetratricopeptide (TPR) repeat protein
VNPTTTVVVPADDVATPQPIVPVTPDVGINADVNTNPNTTTYPGGGTVGGTEKGDAAFKAGDYAAALYNWRHAVVDDPQNPVLLMQLGQALFATGKFGEAAGATQAAMHALPKEKWGVVVSNYKELYGNTRDYTDQLRALENAVKEKPDDPALRFLLGYHYAYLKFPQLAIDQLEKGLKVAPQDDIAKQLRDEMRDKLPDSPPTPTVPKSSVGPEI